MLFGWFRSIWVSVSVDILHKLWSTDFNLKMWSNFNSQSSAKFFTAVCNWYVGHRRTTSSATETRVFSLQILLIYSQRFLAIIWHRVWHFQQSFELYVVRIKTICPSFPFHRSHVLFFATALCLKAVGICCKTLGDIPVQYGLQRNVTFWKQRTVVSALNPQPLSSSMQLLECHTATFDESRLEGFKRQSWTMAPAVVKLWKFWITCRVLLLSLLLLNYE